MASNRSSFIFFPTSTLSLLVVMVTVALLFAANPSSADHVIYGGGSLYGGQYLTYAGYRFIMQEDCNLVLYEGTQAVWSSGTYRKAIGCYVTLERTGQLVIYSNVGSKIWQSNSPRQRENYVLVLQYDRNVVIYGGSVWATGTNVPLSNVAGNGTNANQTRVKT